MRLLTLAGSCALLTLAAVLSCYGPYEQGEACDTTLGGRDCRTGLVCTQSYDECPQYGCPKCRLQCRTDADCADENKDAPCDDARVCHQQQRTDHSGVCGVCDRNPWPPASP